jgi:hypothetical protein
MISSHHHQLPVFFPNLFQNHRVNSNCFLFSKLLSTVRSKIKKIDIAMINTRTLQLAACKNLIQMSLQW